MPAEAVRTPQNTLVFTLAGRVNGRTRFSRSALLAVSAPTTSLKVVSEDFTELYNSSGCSVQQWAVTEGRVV